MERLTKWLNNKKAMCIKQCEKKCVEGYTECHKCDPFKDVMKRLAEYEDAEEQGLLLRLPCRYGDTMYWLIDGSIREVWFKGIRCDKGYKPQIIARYMVNLSAKEEPIAKLENLGKTVFLTREEAKQALAKMQQ